MTHKFFTAAAAAAATLVLTAGAAMAQEAVTDDFGPDFDFEGGMADMTTTLDGEIAADVAGASAGLDADYEVTSVFDQRFAGPEGDQLVTGDYAEADTAAADSAGREW